MRGSRGDSRDSACGTSHHGSSSPPHTGAGASFIAGAAVVGAASALVSWRTRGLRWVLLPHIATDACGVTAARFRLGLAAAGDQRRELQPEPSIEHRQPAAPMRCSVRRLGRPTASARTVTPTAANTASSG